MWKDINGWEEYYEVNDCGDIRNKKTGHVLIGDINSGGYPRVCLYKKDHIPSKQRFFKHRLVAEHFIDNPDNLPEVNHIDGNILNSNVTNLEWCTKEYNELYSHKYGKKEYKPFCVTWNNDVTELFDTKGQLARRLNISMELIKLWLHNKSNTYKNYNMKNIKYCNK